VVGEMVLGDPNRIEPELLRKQQVFDLLADELCVGAAAASLMGEPGGQAYVHPCAPSPAACGALPALLPLRAAYDARVPATPQFASRHRRAHALGAAQKHGRGAFPPYGSEHPCESNTSRSGTIRRKASTSSSRCRPAGSR